MLPPFSAVLLSFFADLPYNGGGAGTGAAPKGERVMQRQNNYELQAAQARKLFCAHELTQLIRVHQLRADEQYLYLRLLSEDYRVSRSSGRIERKLAAQWVRADSFHETLTIFDLLCTQTAGRHAAGEWKTTLDFGAHVHRGLLEQQPPEALELEFDQHPQRLHTACARLGGTPLPGAEISYALPFFEQLRVAVQFWHGDEEFAPRLRFLWDANADAYLRYETMYYAMDLIKARLREYGGA